MTFPFRDQGESGNGSMGVGLPEREAARRLSQHRRNDTFPIPAKLSRREISHRVGMSTATAIARPRGRGVLFSPHLAI
jgi:hypothetical protein